MDSGDHQSRRPVWVAVPGHTLHGLTWLCDKLWNWTTIAWMVAPVWSFAGVMLGIGELALAGRLFLAGNCLVLLGVIFWKELRAEQLAVRLAVTLISAGALTSLSVAEVRWLYHKQEAIVSGHQTRPLKLLDPPPASLSSSQPLPPPPSAVKAADIPPPAPAPAAAKPAAKSSKKRHSAKKTSSGEEPFAPVGNFFKNVGSKLGVGSKPKDK